jgi:uncharacterized membrane protein YjfL (UPF0719 family)
MTWGYPILMLAQLVIAVLLGAVAAYLGVVLFDRATRGIDEWEELQNGNTAIGIVLGAMVLAVAWVLRPALKLPISRWDVGAYRLIAALGVEIVQLGVGLILAVLSILFSLWLFARLTVRLEEWTELKRGNIAVAALLAGVILAIALLVSIAMDGIFQLVTPFLF